MGQAKDGRLWIAWRSNAPYDDYFELDEYPQPDGNTFSPISPSRRIGGSLWYDLPWNGNWDVAGIGASSECGAGGRCRSSTMCSSATVTTMASWCRSTRTENSCIRARVT